MIALRQSTASQEIPLGRFVDSTDGNTEETALTIANTDIKLWKTGATTLASKNSGGATHIANGEYYAVLDATDTDTLGPMKVAVHVSGALSVQVWCNVLPAFVYDSIYTATGAAPLFGIIDQGTAQAATGTTLQLRSAAAFADNELNGATILITGGSAGVGQRAIITGYVGSTDTATVDTWPTTPTGTITYMVFATPPSSTTSLPRVDLRQIAGSNVSTSTAQLGVNVVNVGGSAVAATSGMLNVNAIQISGDSTAADNLESMLDGTGGVTLSAAITGNITGNLSGSVGSVTGAVGSVTGAVASVTGNVGGNVVGSVGSVTTVSDKTGYRLSATGVGDILTTALTESYAADGAAGTLSQILFGLQAFLQEKAVSGTTLTVKKLDGSTTAMTFTLNDATTPTSITRAS